MVSNINIVIPIYSILINYLIEVNMRKSRLGLFKSTSMLISVVGIIMIISTIIVVAYVGYSMVSSGITNEISSGTQYDELAALKSEYNNLSVKFDSVKSTFYAGGPDDVKVYNDAKLELTTGGFSDSECSKCIGCK